MYDTINLWLSIEKIGNVDFSKIIQKMNGIIKHYREDGNEYVTGYIENYKVTLSNSGLSLKGSLAKYFLSDNFQTLSRSDTQRAVEKLSNELGLPMQKAKISRIDVAQNLLMDFKPESYYNYLSDCQYYTRSTLANSLYYSNKLRQKVFYNKVAEAKAKRVIIPDEWKDQYVLRYELRFKSRLPEQFNRSEVLASNLYEEEFYVLLFNKWHSEYLRINKVNSLNFNYKIMKSKKDFWKQMKLKTIEFIGQNEMLEEVENMRNQKVFDKPEYLSRLKREIINLGKAPEITTTSDLVEELDKKVMRAKKDYR